MNRFRQIESEVEVVPGSFLVGDMDIPHNFGVVACEFSQHVAFAVVAITALRRSNRERDFGSNKVFLAVAYTSDSNCGMDASFDHVVEFHDLAPGASTL